jgi:hypothetical protein
MPLIECPDCGYEISDLAFKCPKCGRPRRVQNPRGWNGAQNSDKSDGNIDAGGFIYVFSNPSFGENLYKIGKTTRSANDRARELSTHTGVPEGFKIEFDRWVRDCHEAEAMIHGALNKYHTNKEYFRLPLEKAVQIVEAICACFDEDEAVDPNTGDLKAEPTEDNLGEVPEPAKPEDVSKHAISGHDCLTDVRWDGPPVTRIGGKLAIRCPSCGKGHTVAAPDSGKYTMCPHCLRRIDVLKLDQEGSDDLGTAGGKEDLAKENADNTRRTECIRHVNVTCQNCGTTYQTIVRRHIEKVTCPRCRLEQVWPPFQIFDEDISPSAESPEPTKPTYAACIESVRHVESVRHLEARRFDVRCQNCGKAYTVTLWGNEKASTCPHCLAYGEILKP